MQQQRQTRKWARVLCYPEIIQALFTESKQQVRFYIKDGVPDGTVLINYSYNPMVGAFELILEHESFDDIEVGVSLPLLKSPTFEGK